METALAIWEIASQIIAVAAAIAAATPTPVDDKWVGKVYKYFVEIPALNFGRAKDPNRQRRVWGDDY